MTANDQLRSLTESIARQRQRCADEGHELLRRATIPSGPDGWPRKASGANPGTAIPHTNGDHTDDSDVGYRVGHGDPTGDAACTPPTPDNVATTARRFLRHIATAEAALHRATTELDNARPPRNMDNPNDGWCTNHIRVQIFDPVADSDGELCDFCASYRQATGRLPSTLIMTKRHQTGRLPTIKVTKHG